MTLLSGHIVDLAQLANASAASNRTNKCCVPASAVGDFSPIVRMDGSGGRFYVTSDPDCRDIITASAYPASFRYIYVCGRCTGATCDVYDGGAAQPHACVRCAVLRCLACSPRLAASARRLMRHTCCCHPPSHGAGLYLGLPGDWCVDRNNTYDPWVACSLSAPICDAGYSGKCIPVPTNATAPAAPLPPPAGDAATVAGALLAGGAPSAGSGVPLQPGAGQPLPLSSGPGPGPAVAKAEATVNVVVQPRECSSLACLPLLCPHAAARAQGRCP